VKLVARAPADRVGPEGLEEAVRVVAVATGRQVRAAGFELRPFAGAAIAPATTEPSTRRPSGLVLVWLTDPVDPGQVAALRAAPAGLGWTDAVVVEEHVIADDARPSDVTRIGFLRRRPELSRDEFARHWLTVHAPLVLAHDPLFVRYVANVPVGNANVDGIVEQHFPDAATWAEHDRRIVEERPAVLADVRRMLEDMEQFAATRVATAGGEAARQRITGRRRAR
jgi:hypothetical protein